MTTYDLIAQLRRTHATPTAARTLDLVVRELGLTRDNLREACDNLRRDGLPPEGGRLLDELLVRAGQEGIDDLDYGASPPMPGAAARESTDAGTMGVSLLLGGTALVVLALTAVAVVSGLNTIFHFL